MNKQYKCHISSTKDSNAINSFLNGIDDASFCASCDYDNYIRKHTGQKVFRLIVKEEYKIVGTVGLTLIKSRYFGSRLVATGFFTENNLYLSNNQVLDCIIDKSILLAKENNVDYIEFKGIDLCKNSKIETIDNIYSSFSKFFYCSENELLTKIPRKKRADIRKALKNSNLLFLEGIKFEDFYKIYTISQRNLGTPVQSREFYKDLYQREDSHSYGISFNGEIIAVCMAFIDSKRFLAYYGGALLKARSTHAYDLLYYNLMKISCNKGVIFDFGRSRYKSGGFYYKKNWGFDSKKIIHSFIRLKPSLPNNTPDNPKYRMFIYFWKKLPVSIVNIFGKYLLKYLG